MRKIIYLIIEYIVLSLIVWWSVYIGNYAMSMEVEESHKKINSAIEESNKINTEQNQILLDIKSLLEKPPTVEVYTTNE